MQSLSIKEIKTNICEKVIVKKCPIRRSCCSDSLGKYEWKCPFYKGHYSDTNSVECSFDELSEEQQGVIIKLGLSLKGAEDW